MVETLNEIVHLRNSKFGRPRPRHGLKLLYWFAHECISFDNNNEMHCECNLTRKEFGFHPFVNRYDEYGDKLLPDVDIPYYVVGNLNYEGSTHQLPPDVSDDYSNNCDDSNTDRIIISVEDDEWIENVYVTEHIDKVNFDPDATFRISRGLLMIIRSMTLEDFLWKTGYFTWPQVSPIPFSSQVFPIPFSSQVSPIPFSSQVSPIPFSSQVSPIPFSSQVSPIPFSSQVSPIPFSDGSLETPTSNASGVSPASPSPVQQDIDQETPTAQTNETSIQIEPDINIHKTKASKKAPTKNNGFWDMCAIL